jgi:hypothetical protein
MQSVNSASAIDRDAQNAGMLTPTAKARSFELTRGSG